MAETLKLGTGSNGQVDVVPAGQVTRPEMLAAMAAELLQVQDIPAALRTTVRGVEQGLGGDVVMIVERGEAAPAAPGSSGGGRAGSSLSCAVAGATGPFGLLCVLSDQTRHFPGEDRLFLQAAAAVLSAAIIRLQSESHMHALYRELNHAGVQRVLRILGNCLVQELNQPITAARNYLYTCRHLIEDGALAELPEIARLQDRAMAELGRIGSIVGHLRENMEDEYLDMHDTDINEVIEAALILVQPDIVAMKIRVHRLLQPDLPGMRLDKTMILQLFFNLFRRSFEAMHQSVRRELTVRTGYLHPDQVEVQIADTGHGMDTGFLDNPYVSGSVRSVTDKGFDMAVCRYAIDAHHGQFSLSTTPGGGSTLHLTLPLHA